MSSLFNEPFSVLLVQQQGGSTRLEIGSAMLEDLPPGEVVVEVAYSSLNYKDALACKGHPGVVKQLPHVPGIDAAGRVVASDSERFLPEQEVLVTGYGQGAERWGAYSRYVRVPAEWVVPMPPGIDSRRAMIYGTAGFTAVQCVAALVERGIAPERGPIVVTGSTGGVGSLSVALLAKLGYQVTAITGKAEQADLLRQLGATDVEGRDAVNDASDRPLLSARWAGAVDTVGGVPLATILRSTQHRGVVAACGLVAGEELHLTVHPFILRGVTFAGIDSAKCPYDERVAIWNRLAGEWRVDLPASFVTEVTLTELPNRVEQILAGKVVGRTLVVPHE